VVNAFGEQVKRVADEEPDNPVMTLQDQSDLKGIAYPSM
jgi:hypothetical protein